MKSLTYALAAGLLLAGCTTSRHVETNRDRLSEKADSSVTTFDAARSATAEKKDSAVSEATTAKATEASTNEATEETTETVYDATTGRVARVTTTKRRNAGTVAKTSQNERLYEGRYAWRYESDTSSEHAASSESHSELKRDVEKRTVAKETTTCVVCWAKGVALAVIVVSAVWAVVPFVFPAAGVVVGGGPVWWIFAAFKRNRKQNVS